MINIVIFAAGRGSRLGASIPKFLVEVAKTPIFLHQFQALGNLDAEIYIVIGYRASAVLQLVLEDLQVTGASWRRRLTFIYNEDYRSPQFGSICRALNVVPLTRPTLFIDGDMVFDSETVEQLATCNQTSVVVRETISADGVIADTEQNRVLRFRRGTDGQFEWGNLAFYDTDALEQLSRIVKECKLAHHYELINELILRGKQVNFQVADLAEVDDVDDLPLAEHFVRRQHEP